MLVLCCFALAGELGEHARCGLLLVVVAKCGGCLWDYSLDLFREPADGLGPAGSSALMALIPVSRVLGGFRPSVVGCVSRACVVPGGSAGAFTRCLLGASLASQVCGVLSDEVLVRCDTTVVATFGCSSGVARAVSGCCRGGCVSARLLSVRRGTGLTGAVLRPSAGLTEQRGWVVQGDHLRVPTCLRRAVSALPVRMWEPQAHQLTQVGDSDLKQGC
jgi:hypothetical protein